jgi:hypothetical protein
MLSQARQQVFSTSDKARLVSVPGFDLDQSYPSRQPEFDDPFGPMLQCNENVQAFCRRGNPILHNSMLVQRNKKFLKISISIRIGAPRKFRPQLCW